MLFNSYEFIFAFLPLVLLGWWVLPGRRVRLAFLTLASYVFYSAWEFPHGAYLLPLLVGSTSVDYVAARLLQRVTNKDGRRHILFAALGLNLGALALFKYLGMFTGTIASVIGAIGAPGLMPVTHLVLPIGISFYTFNSMSYTIDVYRRKIPAATCFVEYSAFVACFPHLIAGPIVRFSDLGPQLRNLRPRFTAKMAAGGAYFLVCGLFKKLVVADTLAPHIDKLFAASAHTHLISAWTATFGYGLQLYFDFSGYSDMAVGLALMLGLRFPQNFDSPFKSRNVSEFWRRWHISLSDWLRDYVFIPLGGSRGGQRSTVRNLAITMFLGGLWHGASWVFVIWGGLHGLLLVGNVICKKAGLAPRTPWIGRTITLLCITWLWAPFRAGSAFHAVGIGGPGTSASGALATTGHLWASMLGMHGIGWNDLVTTASSAAAAPIALIGAIVALYGFVLLAPNTWQWRFRPTPRFATALAVMAGVSILVMASPSPFLYFQF